MWLFRGQASSEIMIILGMSLIVVLVAAVIANQYLTDLTIQKAQNDAQLGVYDLANAANNVYRQGIGAKQRVFVRMPSGVNGSSNFTYVGRPDNQPLAIPRAIVIRLGQSDIVAITDVDVNGTMPSSTGSYSLWVIARDTYVQIGNSSN